MHEFGHLQLPMHAMCMEGFINRLEQSSCYDTYVVTLLLKQTR